ncbi:CPBP family intramembrane metalloprotease [Halogeometricum sp. S1BR25-6]|uniref:CPBP family intramembrane metalloprotease n=1 Tax=Halogeometricum salsisoli TaxID=2950536 RepID=A0ABU2GBA8_9EURY|nr:type II CAAX endopeptidase family protein [Halogeometricum sp. S1BR25-6]MDS0298098.1 CPBP family intramembrane metalloprotease [Halogeometricum sp. S1BR25-6]
MPDWATFAAFASVVTAGLLILSFASRGAILPDDERPHRAVGDGSEDEDGDGDVRAAPADPEGSSDRARKPSGGTPDHREVVLPKSGVRYRLDPVREDEDEDGNGVEAGGIPELSTAELLANVAFSQGLFAVFLLAGAWYAQVPRSAFGAGPDSLSVPALVGGAALGVVLYVVNQVGAALGAARGLGNAEELREALAPDTPAGWVVLLFFVLPLIAGFEELLFRGALIGAFAAGFGVSPWLLAVVSSVAFALGHNAQGRLGVLVTGALGFVLAAAYVLTGSLFAVVLAHYLVNALEFVVHEGLELDWAGRLT